MKFTVTKYLAGLFFVSFLTGCIDTDSDSNTASTTTSSTRVTSTEKYPMTEAEDIVIVASGIKGPLASADAMIYQFDPSFPDFYDENSPLSSSISDQFAQINGLSVPGDSLPPYILTVGGPNAIDLNSGMAPVISTLVTVVTQDMLNSSRPVYATPLTTLAFHMARHGAGATVDASNFLDHLDDAASKVSATFAISEDVAIDLFNSPLVINDDTDTLSRQQEAVHHRAALEAFAAKVHALARPDLGTSADDIIDRVAVDLQSDGVIDNKASGTTVGTIDPVLLNQDPMEMEIPNTGARVKEIMVLMEEERTLILTDRGPVLQTDAIDFGTQSSGPPAFPASSSPDPEAAPAPAPAPAPGSDLLTLDNGKSGTSSIGAWTTSSAENPFGSGSLYSKQSGDTYTYNFNLASPGEYQVFAWWTEWSTRPTSVPYDISHLGGTSTVEVNQQQKGGQWNQLGTTSNFGLTATITIRSLGNGSTNADAIKLVPVGVNGSTGPSITPTVIPELNADNVFTNRKISAEFNNVSNLSVSEYSLTSEDGTVLGVDFSNDDSTAVMVPTAPLSKGSRFTAHLAATMLDSNGNPRATDYYWSFTTIDPSRSEFKFYHDFDDENPGQIYTKDDLKIKWQNHEGGHFGRDRDTAVVVKEPENSPGNVLSVLHKADEYGASPGVSWTSDIGSHDELYLAYDVMFEDGYDFSLGGKLPGLSGGDASVSNGGGGPPNGDDGWSGRLVFFSKKSGYPVDGAITNYMYLPTNTGKYGQSYKWSIGGQRALTPGKWHTLEIRYKMNTPGKANGTLQAWLNGELAMDKQSVTYRTIQSLKINQLVFNTFHGGNSPAWAPSHDQHIFFDNVVLSTQPISH